jgi:hypothetical protein
MIVPFMDGNTGTAVYINPDYIVTLPFTGTAMAKLRPVL